MVWETKRILLYMPFPIPHDHMSKRMTFVIIGGVALLGFLAITARMQNGRVERDATHAATRETSSAAAIADSRLPCIVSSGSHGHVQGVLTAEFTEDMQLSGWSCVISSHNKCTAGPNGMWTSCSYPPDMGWPDPVPQSAIENPLLYEVKVADPLPQ